ncbi:MAG: MoaD family protein [Nitrososphaerota archaeon]|nr:MoaD family protein [Candidatus Bathyarchaeota archaeon]MDW8049247.1 MoaD family protein [Nitrososphaerota archaeon]
MVYLKFLGVFKKVVGLGELFLSFNGGVLSDLIKKLVELYPNLKKALLDPDLEDPRPNALILVNGKEISVLDGLNTKIKDDDEIIIIPVTHGG